MVSFAEGADASLAPLGANSQTVPIFVKSLAGLTITVDVTLSETIASVKAKVAEILSQFSVYRTRLVFAGRDMQDDHTLSSYDIKRESTVYVIGRLMVDCTPIQPIAWPVQCGEEATAELATSDRLLSELAMCISASNLPPVEPADCSSVVSMPFVCQPSLPVVSASNLPSVDAVDYSPMFCLPLVCKPCLPVVGASIWVRRCDGVSFFVQHDTRQSAVDYLRSLKLHQAIPDYIEAPAAQDAATSECREIGMGAGAAHQVILVKGTTPPPPEKMFNLFGRPPRMTKTLLLKPSELMTFVNFPWDEIETEQIEDHVYKLVYSDAAPAATAYAVAVAATTDATATAAAADAAAVTAAAADAAATAVFKMLQADRRCRFCNGPHAPINCPSGAARDNLADLARTSPSEGGGGVYTLLHAARQPSDARKRAQRSLGRVLAEMKLQDESELGESGDSFY
jgi:hypothetical protein